VHKSPRRESGKISRGPGPRLKLVALLTVAAVSAAGYFAFEPANLWPGELVGKLWGADCNSSHSSDADKAPTCSPTAATRHIQQFTDTPETDANTFSPADSFQNEANNFIQSSHANKPRAWNYSQSSSDGLRPGYTIAELCLSGLDDQGSRCQAGSYDDKFNTSESGAMSGSASEYRISGRVLTTEGIGLNGVTIVASPERLQDQPVSNSETLRFWTVTDSLGAYSFDRLPDGEYTIRSGTHGPYRSARISARTGVSYADLVVYPNTTTIVDGQVLSNTGEPLEGVTVLPNLLGQPSVLTDYDGRFRLTVALKPATHSFALRFQNPGYLEQSSKVKPGHPGATHSAAVNVVMYPVESWTSLSGTIYGDSEEPLAGRAVELRPQSAQRTYSAITDRQGRYTFPVVESPADYQLIVFGGAGHKDYQQPVHMTVDADELDVVVQSYEFGEVTGQLVNLSGIPVPDFDLVLRNTGSRKPNAVVSTDELGNFEIPAAPAGEFVMASQSTPSIMVQGLHLKPGGKLHLPLVLDWGQHEIRGIVLDARNNPVPASRIVLRWSHQVDGITTKATRRTAADTQGQFAFSNLGPGPHSLQIDAPGFSTVDIDHDLSRQGYDVMVRLN
jgi:hypothetical protein